MGSKRYPASHTFLLRLPPTLWERVVALAHQDRRSVNNWLVGVIARAASPEETSPETFVQKGGHSMFTMDNTNGYTQQELDTLNTELAERLQGIEEPEEREEITKWFSDEVARR